MAHLAEVSQQKGDEFMKQGDTKLTRAEKFFCIDKNGTKEEAAELFTKAAAQYKICKRYQKAGDAHIKSAETQISIENILEAKIAWKEAGKCYRHTDHNKAIELYENAIQMDLDENRMYSAAKLQQEIATILEDDLHIEEAIIAYEKAAEYHEMEHKQNDQHRILLIVAKLHGIQKNWNKSATIFENTAKVWVNDKLLRWKVKELLFKAALLRICSLCDDESKEGNWKMMEDKQADYCDISNIYETSREYRLIGIIVQCLGAKKADVNGFKEAWSGYDRICGVDKWRKALFYHILECMEHKKEKDDVDELEKELMGGMNDDDDDDDVFDDDGDEKDEMDGKGKQSKEQPAPFEKLDKDKLIGAPDPEEF